MAQLLTEDRCDEECLHPESVRPILPRLLSASQAEATAEWFAMLADPTRTRILQALALAPELCVCDLALALDMSVSALSHQLRYLRERGVVARRKDGRVAFYSLGDDHVRHVLTDALTHIAEDGAETVSVA
jgi:DNA-binding transcriptional ArsR family regulator